MLQADVTAARWQQDSDGAWLCLRVQSPTSAMTICDEMKPDKQYVAQIKRKGRSLNANAYAWVLLDKLVCYLTNTAIKTVSRIQITAIALTEVLLECGCQRKLCPAEPVNCLPVISHGKQRGLRVLLTQGS